MARISVGGEREVAASPELRIVDDELWSAVIDLGNGLQALRWDAIRMGSRPLNRAHRREFLLSGLLTCGCCGGGFTIVGKDRYGCATRRGPADPRQRHHHQPARNTSRPASLGAFKGRLLTRGRVEEYVRAFAEAWAELEREAGAKRTHLDRALAEADREIQGMVRAIEGSAPGARRRRPPCMNWRTARPAQTDLAALDEPAPVTLHPNATALMSARSPIWKNCAERPDRHPHGGRSTRCGH